MIARTYSAKALEMRTSSSIEIGVSITSADYMQHKEMRARSTNEGTHPSIVDASIDVVYDRIVVEYEYAVSPTIRAKGKAFVSDASCLYADRTIPVHYVEFLRPGKGFTGLFQRTETDSEVIFTEVPADEVCRDDVRVFVDSLDATSRYASVDYDKIPEKLRDLFVQTNSVTDLRFCPIKRLASVEDYSCRPDNITLRARFSSYYQL